jgi:hypothetical protein
VQRALSDEIFAVSGRVPHEVFLRLQRIDRLVRGVLPRLKALPLGSPELFLVERTALDYLPTALNTYLRLPGGYISSEPGSLGRPALTVLLEELDVMEREMQRVSERVNSAEMDRLLAHGRFLEERMRLSTAAAKASSPAQEDEAGRQLSR